MAETGFEDLDTLLAQAWARLGRATADRRAAYRTPVLATLTPEGAPDARTVVLRSAERAAGRVTIFTDARSGKMAGIARDPRASLVAWDPGPSLQLRLGGTLHLGDATERAHRWAQVPTHATADYGAGPPPGTPIAAPAPRPTGGDVAAFVVLHLVVDRLDILHLGRERHQREAFHRASGWTGEWLAP